MKKKVVKLGSIVDKSASDMVEQGLVDYGTTTIEQRAIPDFRDGFKPVQRRILYDMFEKKIFPGKGLKKSAAVVGDTMGKYHPHGDCLYGNTLVPLLDGKTKTIKELTEEGKSKWVLAFDKENNKYVPAIAHSWRVGQVTSIVYDINLANGDTYTVTENHPFLSINRQWIKTIDLKPSIELVGGTLGENCKYPIINPNTGSSIPIHQIVGKFLYGNVKGVFHHNNENINDNQPNNIIYLTKEDHAKIHGDYIKGLENGRKSMFSADSDIRESIQIKNSILLTNYNKKLPLIKAIKAINLLLDRNIEPTRKAYESLRLEHIIYNLTKLKTLFKKGYINSFEELISIAKSGKTVIDNTEAKGLTKKLYEKSYIKDSISIQNKKDRTSKTLKCFSEVMHYALEQGYTLESLTWDIYDKIILSFMKENKYFPFSEDVIYTSSEKIKEKFINISPIDLLHKTSATFIVSIVKRTLSKPVKMYDFTVDKYHNMAICSSNGNFVITHNSSIFSTLVNLVHDRYPLVFGLGNWGDEYSPPAAPRYIDCRLNELALQLFEYIDIAEFTENYSGDSKEPVVLPSKIPLLLMNGAMGIAVGVSVGIPPHNLKELIIGLILLIRKPSASLNEILKYIKGPDYRLGGVLTSSENNLYKLYENGKGSLTFRCQYKFISEGKTKILKIFNFAPHFNKECFLSKCDDLVKKGLLEYAVDDSANGNHTISVGFISSNIIKERVLPLLDKSISYQFHITERQVDDVSFRKTNLKDLMLDWLDYQREIKTQYYKYIINKFNKELIKHKARLIATKNIDIVTDALKNKDPLKILIKYLKISEEEANYILDCKIGLLAKISLNDHKKRIKQINDNIILYKNKTSNLDKEIIKDLKTLAPFCDERRTLLRENPPNIDAKCDLWILLLNNTIKKIVNNTKIKYFNSACLERDGFYSLDEAGICIKWKYDDEVKLYPNTFEIIAGDYKYIIVIDANGNYSAINLSILKKKEFLTLKTNTKIIQAVGCNDGDKIIVCNNKNKILRIPEDIKIFRSNTKGTKIIKNIKNIKNIKLKVYSPGDTILNVELRKINLEDIVKSKTFYLIGKYNIVKENQSTTILNKDETIIRMKNNFDYIKKIR